MREIENTKYYSKKLGELPKGCQMCVKGEKLVLYITGICPRQCWYCPLSENRKDIDVIYANELKLEDIKDLINEARISNSKGAGITGGDPLSKIDRTCEYIKILKNEFGKDFHIHLYTSFVLVNEENLNKLFDTGLDEIRFHPDLKNKKDWEKIDLVNKYTWDVGLEIPAIPNYKLEIFEMIDFFLQKNIKFLNINELEVAQRNFDEMEKENYIIKKDTSHGIKGSAKLAKEILDYLKYKNINVHYCPSKLKDKVQMLNRYKLRAKNVANKFDIINDEGLLIRGCIYLPKINPSFIDYKEKFQNINKNEVIEELIFVKKMLEDEGLDILLDEKKLRLLTYPEHIEQFADVLKGLNLVPVIIEEDPTVEQFEINRDFL